MTPTARTLAHLRKCGITCGVVEQYIAAAGIRRDFLGVIDVIAVNPAKNPCIIVPYSHVKDGIVGIQTTTSTNEAARCAKIAAEPRIAEWLACGAAMELWSWSKKGGRGKRKLWTLRRSKWDGEKWSKVE